jgi:hypothetical protein
VLGRVDGLRDAGYRGGVSWGRKSWGWAVLVVGCVGDSDAGIQPEGCADLSIQGIVTPGCPCVGETTAPCYPADADTTGTGPCRQGLSACALREGNRSWGACEGAVVPSVEACNGIDDDCNGAVDDTGAQCGYVPEPQPPLDAGDPPVVACDPDGPPCELPPSTCADTNFLVYYTGGECAKSYCQWEKHFELCDYGCWYGGCEAPYT